MKKRMLSLILAVCMIFTMAPMNAFATEGDTAPPVGISDVTDSGEQNSGGITTNDCTCDPQIEGEGVHTNTECPLYAAEKRTLENV